MLSKLTFLELSFTWSKICAILSSAAESRARMLLSDVGTVDEYTPACSGNKSSCSLEMILSTEEMRESVGSVVDGLRTVLIPDAVEFLLGDRFDGENAEDLVVLVPLDGRKGLPIAFLLKFGLTGTNFFTAGERRGGDADERRPVLDDDGARASFFPDAVAGDFAEVVKVDLAPVWTGLEE